MNKDKESQAFGNVHVDKLDHGVGLSDVRYAKATFDASVVANQGIGSHGLGIFIPTGAIIMDGLIEVTTLFDDGAGKTATIAIQVESAADILTAVAVGTGFTAGLKDIKPLSTAATMFKTTVAREITAVVAVGALTAGKFNIFIEYVE